ncbi:DUF1659 domain-containing protein [Fictibacillus iocasae]|uniref:DUF1659 domain-containing protein n=1 Tax=Fictibacillus iocasae TaxID=2715437 RepID=A0ABW2NR30_9BACL
MAQASIQRSQLQMVFQQGVDGEGYPVLKRKNFSSLKTTATPDQMLAVANALSGLQQHVLYAVERNNAYDIHT